MQSRYPGGVTRNNTYRVYSHYAPSLPHHTGFGDVTIPALLAPFVRIARLEGRSLNEAATARTRA